MTVGEALKSAPSAVNQSFRSRVLRSSATTASVTPLADSVPAAALGKLAATETYRVPFVPNAGPPEPATLAPPVLQVVTFLSFAARSIAHTALGAAPHPFDVLV